jgi:polyphosphate kinase
VRSIVGRYLEHSRIFAFGTGEDCQYFIGSADLRARNLDRRIEVVTPVVDPSLQARLQEVLDTSLADTAQAWTLATDGTWSPPPDADDRTRGTHHLLMEAALRRARPRLEHEDLL